MEISNPQTLDHIIGANGNVIRVKHIEITDWNMDTIATKNVAHGLTYDNIIASHVVIDMDAPVGDGQFNLEGDQNASGTPDGFYWIGSVNVALARTLNEGFDNPNFDDAGHRGHILIWYIE